MKPNYEKHLNHPFYEKAEIVRQTVRLGQIKKGAEKYPEPFNPDSWTAQELLEHAMQENVDQAHYMYGLYEKITKLEKALDFYAQSENHTENIRNPFNSEYYQSRVMKDGGATARQALGYEQED